jgi:hypothetical protein
MILRPRACVGSGLYSNKRAGVGGRGKLDDFGDLRLRAKADRRRERWQNALHGMRRDVRSRGSGGATAYRYDLTRDVRSWSIKLLIAALSIPVVLGLSCLFPAILIGAGGIMLVTARIWLRLLIIALRSLGGGVASSLKGGDFASANRRLRKELDVAVEPVACPKCGWYQPDMVSEARARSFAWTYWIVLGLVVLAPAIWFSAWTYRFINRIPILDLDGNNPIVLAGAVAVLTLLAVGLTLSLRWVVALAVDPNTVIPGSLPMFPDAPLAITEAEWTQKMGAHTARITATRQVRSPAMTAGPRRIVPPQSSR